MPLLDTAVPPQTPHSPGVHVPRHGDKRGGEGCRRAQRCGHRRDAGRRGSSSTPKFPPASGASLSPPPTHTPSPRPVGTAARAAPIAASRPKVGEGDFVRLLLEIKIAPNFCRRLKIGIERSERRGNKKRKRKEKEERGRGREEKERYGGMERRHLPLLLAARCSAGSGTGRNGYVGWGDAGMGEWKDAGMEAAGMKDAGMRVRGCSRVPPVPPLIPI